MPPGQESCDVTNILFSQISQATKNCVSSGCLGFKGYIQAPNKDQNSVFDDFKERLTRYKTGLPWRGNNLSLPNIEANSLRRLASLMNKLEGKEQIAYGIIEKAEQPSVGKELHLS